jgi:CheY-like chemotaxis protein
MENLYEGDLRYAELHEIEKAAESAKTLTRQLLAFSRKQVLEMKPVDLGKVLGDFRKILRRTIREDIDIRIQTSASLSFVRADAGQIEQIIMNLCVNAQDAMPMGGMLTLAIEEVFLDDSMMKTDPEALPGEYVLLMVSDTGTGMDEETLMHIFEPFYSTKDKAKGTGLGLSTVFGIVKQHSGFIKVSSEPGKGSIFRIYLPKIEDLSEPDGKASEDSRPKEKVGGTETILVVEDNPQVRDLVHRVLNKLGYLVISAEDGQECQMLLEEYDDPIDLLITDVIMPDMNGKELYETILRSRPGLPVIYISGYTDEVIGKHGVLEKGVDLIHKPFTSQALAEMVRKVLDR